MQESLFFSESHCVLSLCESKKIIGCTTSSCLTDVFYLVRKASKNNDTAYKALKYIITFLKILPVTSNDIIQAYNIRADDFEDCLLAVCGINNKCQAIVTRNARDFEKFNIPVYSPQEIISYYC